MTTPTNHLLTATDIGALGEDFFEPMTNASPLSEPVLDLMSAAANDAMLPAPTEPLTAELRNALGFLLAPAVGTAVAFTSGTDVATLSLYRTDDRVVRFDRRRAHFYDLWGPLPIGEVAKLLAAPLHQGRTPKTTDQSAAVLSTTAYFALLAWIGVYRDVSLPEGIAPAAAVIKPGDLIAHIGSPDMVGAFFEMAALGAPTSFGSAIADASTKGITELQALSILTPSHDGISLAPHGCTLVSSLAFPEMALSVTTVELETNRAATLTITSGETDHITTLDTHPADDGWTFALQTLDPNQVAGAVAAALAPAEMFASPLIEGEQGWPVPLLRGLEQQLDNTQTD